jgi:hypothetical protein
MEFRDELEKRVWVAAFEINCAHYVNIMKTYNSNIDYARPAFCAADCAVENFRERNKK